MRCMLMRIPHPRAPALGRDETLWWFYAAYFSVTRMMEEVQEDFQRETKKKPSIDYRQKCEELGILAYNNSQQSITFSFLGHRPPFSERRTVPLHGPDA